MLSPGYLSHTFHCHCRASEHTRQVVSFVPYDSIPQANLLQDKMPEHVGGMSTRDLTIRIQYRVRRCSWAPPGFTVYTLRQAEL